MDNVIKNVFVRRIDRTEQRQYLRIPFTVEADVESVTIAYRYVRHRNSEEGAGKTVRTEGNIVDLALEDPGHNLVGASGSNRMEITIHENYATPAYSPTKLVAGTWYLVLGAYRIEEGGCPVEVTITQVKKGGVLLKGDCHTHTVHSDGWYTVDEMVARARQDKLDYLFVTDHNSMTSNPFIRSYPDITVLPGVEMTYYDGHYNLFGLNRPVRTNTANSREEILAIMREGRENGALCSLNHPLCPNCGWRLGFDGDVPADMIEIWNGPFVKLNADAIAFWHQQLCGGRKWAAIGGSDCHHDELFRIFATPATFLYSRSRSGSDILDAMRQGHAFVGMDQNAPRIHMAMGDARMGDTFVGGGQEILQLTVEGVGASDEIRLIDQTGVIWQDTPGACLRFEMEHVPSQSLFLRVEIWRDLMGMARTLASISNPIYLH